MGCPPMVSRIQLVINSFNGMELPRGEFNSPSSKPSIPIGVFWYLFPCSLHDAQATGRGRKLATGHRPRASRPSLFSIWLSTRQVGMRGSRRAHSGVGQGACEAAIPGSASWKRRVGRSGCRFATHGPRVRTLSPGIALGAKEAWRDASGRFPPSVPRSPAALVWLPKLTLAGQAHTPPFRAPRTPPWCAMPAPNTPEPRADRGVGSTSGQILGKRFPVPAPPRPPPPAEPSVPGHPSPLSASRALGSASRWAAAPAIPASPARLGVRLLLLKIPVLPRGYGKYSSYKKTALVFRFPNVTL